MESVFRLYRVNFPLDFIDRVLDSLTNKKNFSLLDKYSGYNQTKIFPRAQEKITVTHPWGTYA